MAPVAMASRNGVESSFAIREPRFGVRGVNIPTEMVQMLPVAMVMLVLVLFARHSVLPPALGLPYVRGQR
jgi:ABC-type uncharacterized transport system permease subunit